VHFSKVETREQLAHLLKATLRLPSFNGGAYVLDGQQLVDGGYAAPIALQSAKRAGATHALVVLNQRREDYGDTSLAALAERLWLRRRFGADFMVRYDESQGSRALISTCQYDAGLRYVPVLRPDGATCCSNLEMDVSNLQAAWQEGRECMQKFLDELYK
jgi:predicted patatin/cPLA2 family phospholipase